MNRSPSKIDVKLASALPAASRKVDATRAEISRQLSSSAAAQQRRPGCLRGCILLPSIDFSQTHGSREACSRTCALAGCGRSQVGWLPGARGTQVTAREAGLGDTGETVGLAARLNADHEASDERSRDSPTRRAPAAPSRNTAAKVRGEQTVKSRKTAPPQQQSSILAGPNAGHEAPRTMNTPRPLARQSQPPPLGNRAACPTRKVNETPSRRTTTVGVERPQRTAAHRVSRRHTETGTAAELSTSQQEEHSQHARWMKHPVRLVSRLSAPCQHQGSGQTKQGQSQTQPCLTSAIASIKSNSRVRVGQVGFGVVDSMFLTRLGLDKTGLASNLTLPNSVMLMLVDVKIEKAKGG